MVATQRRIRILQTPAEQVKIMEVGAAGTVAEPWSLGGDVNLDPRISPPKVNVATLSSF
jgi:hypothetical protein